MQVVCIVLLAVAAFVCLYHVFLAAIALCSRNAVCKPDKSPSNNFAVVIPAHDEEHTIECALCSCEALDYPKEQYTVYVVADNCSDRTAEIAVEHGAVCLVRNDEHKRGKGFALEWAFPHVLAEGHDAIIVLDADCRIDSRALLTIDCRMKAGAKVLQTSCDVANPDANALSFVLALANTLENVLFYAPKSVLGLPVFLRGTGVVLHREVLARYPWRARSIVEDAEYTFCLLEHGIRVEFVPNAHVVSDFPIRQDQLGVQRSRWISGALRGIGSHGIGLLLGGIKKRKWQLIDAALTSLILSRPLIVGQLVLTGGVALLCQRLAPGLLSDVAVLGFWIILAAYVLYVVTGVGLLGVTPRRLRLLAQSPIVVLRYLLLFVTAVLLSRADQWNRTPRIQQPRQP